LTRIIQRIRARGVHRVDLDVLDAEAPVELGLDWGTHRKGVR